MKLIKHDDYSYLIGKTLNRNRHPFSTLYSNTKIVVSSIYISDGRPAAEGWFLWDENGKSFWEELNDR